MFKGVFSTCHQNYEPMFDYFYIPISLAEDAKVSLRHSWNLDPSTTPKISNLFLGYKSPLTKFRGKSLEPSIAL